MSKRLTNIQTTAFLNDFVENSHLEFLDEGKKDEIIQVAKVRGINLKNNKDLSGIKCIYAFADRPNKNGAILPEKELLEVLPTMISKPINIAHQRRYVVGHILDFRYIQKGKVVIVYGVLYRSNFGDEWKQIKKDFKDKKLNVSFEIWSPEDKRKYNSDGTYELHQMEIAGCAILFRDVEPAFDGARVLALAKKLEQEIPELVFASKKYKCPDLLIATGQLKCSKCGRCKKNIGAEVKTEIKTEPTPNIIKIKCSNCDEEIDYNGIDVRIKCSKCFAILNKEGTMQFPPQIRDFRLLCPSCKIDKWLILEKSDKQSKLKCEGCSKEYKIEFAIDTSNKLEGFRFLYVGDVSCHQCKNLIKFSTSSTIKEHNFKCPRCKLEFSFDMSEKRYKQISKIKEIKPNALEKSQKGGQAKMELKLEIGKDHLYFEGDIDKFIKDEIVSNDYAEIYGYIEPEKAKELVVSKKLTEEERKALPDSAFAVAINVKDKKTNKERKIRMLPVPDEAHIKNALTMLNQAKMQTILKKLGVNIEDVKKKILERAKELKPTIVKEDKTKTSAQGKVSPKKASKEEVLEDEIKKLASQVITLKKQLEKTVKERDTKIDFYKVNAKKIIERKEELGEKFVKDLSDEDILNDDKFNLAKAKKENILLKAKLETSSTEEIVGNKVDDKEDYYTKTRKQINKKAFPKRK